MLVAIIVNFINDISRDLGTKLMFYVKNWFWCL